MKVLITILLVTFLVSYSNSLNYTFYYEYNYPQSCLIISVRSSFQVEKVSQIEPSSILAQMINKYNMKITQPITQLFVIKNRTITADIVFNIELELQRNSNKVALVLEEIHKGGFQFIKAEKQACSTMVLKEEVEKAKIMIEDKSRKVCKKYFQMDYVQTFSFLRNQTQKEEEGDRGNFQEVFQESYKQYVYINEIYKVEIECKKNESKQQKKKSKKNKKRFTKEVENNSSEL